MGWDQHMSLCMRIPLGVGNYQYRRSPNNIPFVVLYFVQTIAILFCFTKYHQHKSLLQDRKVCGQFSDLQNQATPHPAHILSKVSQITKCPLWDCGLAIYTSLHKQPISDGPEVHCHHYVTHLLDSWILGFQSWHVACRKPLFRPAKDDTSLKS